MWSSERERDSQPSQPEGASTDQQKAGQRKAGQAKAGEGRAGQGAPADDRLRQAIAALRDRDGLDFARSRRVLTLLTSGEWQSLTDLVRHAGVSRRWALDVVNAVEPWSEQADGRSRVLAAHTARVRELAGCEDELPAGFGQPDLADPLLARALAAMRDAYARMPPSVWSLDHVPATPETAVRRAQTLRANYDLTGRHVLCLGDHDLTSIALGLLAPAAQISVVDIDDRLISHIDALSRQHGLAVSTVFADLRAELPASLDRAVDLVFTDPPYTPAGIELFLSRALTALRRAAGNRVLFCYSPNDRQLGRGLEVQQVVGGLHLAIEALLPGFNEFAGAESIGGRSALWVCQPTSRTFATVERRITYRSLSSGAIYTRGRQAEETGGAEPRVIETLREHAGRGDARPITVGLGHDADVPLTSLLRAEPPAGRGGVAPPGSTLLVDLTEVDASYAGRVLLRGLPASRVVFAVSASRLARCGLADAGRPIRRLLSARYTVELTRRQDLPEVAVLVADLLPAERVPAELAVARHVLDHPRARLLSAWREAVIACARRQGETVTKNEARARVAGMAAVAPLRDRFLCELPQPTLEAAARALTAPAEPRPTEPKPTEPGPTPPAATAG